jgi:hypothetical protein
MLPVGEYAHGLLDDSTSLSLYPQASVHARSRKYMSRKYMPCFLTADSKPFMRKDSSVGSEAGTAARDQAGIPLTGAVAETSYGLL